MCLLIVYRHLLYPWALGCLFINPEFSFPCVSTLCARITKGTFRLQETEQGLLGMRLGTGMSSQGSRIRLVQLRWCCSLGPALCMTSFSQSQCRQPWSTLWTPLVLRNLLDMGKLPNPCRHHGIVGLCPVSMSFSRLNIGASVFTWKCSTKDSIMIWKCGAQERAFHLQTL